MKNILFVVLAVCLFAACKKTEELGEAPRLFRPVISGQLSADSNTIVAAWLKVTGAKSYRLQLSRDTFRTIDLSILTDTNVAVVKQLLFNQLYQVQVSAVASDTTRNSGWSMLGPIRTLSSILKMPAIDDITFNSVRVRWITKGAPVSSIKILKTADSSVVAQVSLNAVDIANEFKVVSGLTAATKYTIFLNSGTNIRGYVDFNTKAPFSGTVIDLTGITGRPSVLADTLPVIASGSTVLLKRGEIYNIAASYSFNKSLVIMSGPDLSVTGQAKIFFTNNFNFAAGATIDSIEFNDVHMYSDSYGSRYIFNTTNSANVGKIKFMNSRVEIFRGVLRLQSGTTTVNNFIIDNSIVDSIAGFGVLTVGVASCKVDNILFTRSTIYKAEKVISSVQNSTSLLFESCTFNEVPAGNGYYIDYSSASANTISNGITISNCIFGVAKNIAANVLVRGYRANAATVVSSSNNYRTSDFVSGGNDFPNVTTYTRPAAQLWENPAAGNFKIADATYPGRSSNGDPRWRF
ncbi:MAG: DUF5123 domain-containing protein [Ferruginibacter sp.]|nr:DUF5123 domain-containing protein [Ferruginibacter sp.]